MTVIRLMAAYGTLLLAGGGVALLVLSPARRLNVVEWLGLAWLCGIGTISVLLAVLSILLHGLWLEFAIILAALSLAVAGWDRQKRLAAQWYIPWPSDRWEWLLTTLIVAQVTAVFYAAMNRVLGWDGLLVWEIKARYAFLNDGVLPIDYFQRPGLLFSHPEYPLGLPLAQLWTYLWLGEPNQFWAKLMFPVFYAVGVALLALLTTRITGFRIVGLGVAAMLFFVPQITVAVGSAIDGYADFPLSVFYLATIGYLTWSAVSRSGPGFNVFAAMLPILPWIKREGAILWIIGASAGALVNRVQHQPLRRLFMLAPGLGIIVGWQLFLSNVGEAHPADFLPVTIGTLWAHLDRIGGILSGMLTVMMATREWSCFWLLAAIALLYMVRRCRNLETTLLAGATVLPPLIYSSTYVFSAWDQHYLEHLRVSATRLLMHTVPLACMMIAAAVARDFSSNQLGCGVADRSNDLLGGEGPAESVVTPIKLA